MKGIQTTVIQCFLSPLQTVNNVRHNGFFPTQYSGGVMKSPYVVVVQASCIGISGPAVVTI